MDWAVGWGGAAFVFVVVFAFVFIFVTRVTPIIENQVFGDSLSDTRKGTL